MPDAKSTLLIVLGAVAVGFALFWTRSLFTTARTESVRPSPY